MRLAAISVGYAIPSIDFDATVHSVFHSAVNLKPANDTLLLTLVSAGEDDLPQGIRLDSPDDFSFEQLSVGWNVFCRDQCLIFENSILAVDFNHCRRWQCDIPALGTDMTSRATMEAWKCVWKLLNDRQKHCGAEIVAEALLSPGGLTQSAISRRLGETVRILIEAARDHRSDDLSALTRVIGLGTGLTPCGDDFLVGYLAGLWCTVRDSVEHRQYVSKLSQVVIHRSGSTNDISRTYLYHAAHGQISNRLYSLAKAISKPESPARILPVAESAMHSGHTSGMDAVTGLLFGLSTWGGETLLALG
jgi:Protein of unknown function (DUF2877)